MGGQVWVLIISSFSMGSTLSSWSGGTHLFAPTQLLLETSLLELQLNSKGPTKRDRGQKGCRTDCWAWLHYAVADPTLLRPERKMLQEQHRSLAPQRTYTAPSVDWQTSF